ncbi:MAG: tetratricopeptide repeat protein [Candidatus Cloacimonetes bacterium]|nr:tetratricopeptide repeat protein [Candidatus Cloacimonadota bacterium]
MILVALIIFIVLPCAAQYNEKQIMQQQAYQLLAQRQYAQAEQLFLQILDKYPGDFDSIVQLFNIYNTLSQADKAEDLLATYQRGLPPQLFSEQHIQLQLLKGEVDAAYRESLNYLELYSDENKFRQLASYFERKGIFDKTLELYKLGRNKLKKPDLFRLEIANTSLNYRLFDQAITEYLAYLFRYPTNQYFTNNQFKIILQEDPSRIETIKDVADTTSLAAIKEVYATSLLSIGQPRSALKIIKELGLNNLRIFAENQAAAGNDSIAYEAYEHASTMVDDPISFGFPTRMMQIRYQQGDYEGTAKLGYATLANASRFKTKSSILVEIYRLMANTKLALGEPVDSALVWLDEAQGLNPEPQLKAGISIDIARLQILSSNYAAAEKNLKGVSIPQLLPQREYLRFLGALLSGDITYADSLMNEYLIKYPGSPEANDSMYLMMLALALQAPLQQSFFDTFKLLQLNQTRGLDSLIVIMEASKDEEFRLLAIEWALRFNRPDLATTLLDHEFADPVAGEYAETLKFFLVHDKEEEQRLAREFLKNKPNSIYSPDVRQRISRWAAQRPNL